MKLRTLSLALAVAITGVSAPVALAQTYTKIETTTYHDDKANWIIGQVKSQSVNGLPTVSADYNAKARPTAIKQFGTVVQTISYNADGTIASVSDAKNNAIGFSSWMRGVPRLITMPGNTSQSATVDDNGWIRTVTNQVGATTTYGYDAMGRTSSVQYPQDDTVQWNTETTAFVQVASEEFGIPAGHWRQTQSKGNWRRESYFDALWRPLFVREYDSASPATTESIERFTYDHAGRALFRSYPSRGSAISYGTWTEYDPLGRTTSVSVDGEAGLLTTTTSYLGDGSVRVRTPRQTESITRFQAFDKPSNDFPVSIQMPESAVTEITRDVFGKPLVITRRSNDNTKRVDRRYVYQSDQRLCKVIEPETGATVYGYDAVGNMTQSASGLALPDTQNCNQTEAWASTRVVNRTYDTLNRLSTLSFPDGRGNQSFVYEPDGLSKQIVTDNEPGVSVTNAYTYNRRRLMTGESIAMPGRPAMAFGYGYDQNGNLATNTYPSGTAVSYNPNARGQASQSGSYATGVAYHPNGAISGFTYGNGIVHSMTQNAGRLPARSTDTGGSNPLDMQFAYDGNGNVTQITDMVDTNLTRQMTYDGRDRLLTTQSGMFSGDGVARFAYDALDNITEFKVGALRNYSYVYGPEQRLLNVKEVPSNATVIGLAYDDQGNVINKNGNLFDFDIGNRLRQAIGKERYQYDGHGRRVLSRGNSTGDIYSFYSADGVLRRLDDQRAGKVKEYMYLGGSLVAAVTLSSGLAVPVLQVPSYSSQNSYSVTWNGISGATRYELQEQAAGGNFANVQSGTTTSYAATARPPGTYSYRVRACATIPCSDWSATATVLVQQAPTASPVLNVPGTAVNGNLTVTWSAVANATRYQLESASNGGAWTLVHDSAATSKAINNLPAGTTQFRGRACNDAGCGAYSNQSSTTAIYPPGAPSLQGLPSSNNTGSFTVAWSAVGGATRYEAEQSFNSAAFVPAYSGGQTSFGLSGLGDGSYTYRVKACNDAGCGAYSSNSSTVVITPPNSNPTFGPLYDSTTGNYTVTWSGVDRADRYELEESVNGGSWGNIFNANGLSHGVTGRGNAGYRYRVRACNGGGCGPYSPESAITVNIPPPIPPVPVNIRFRYQQLGGTQTHYYLDWNASATATKYDVTGFFGLPNWTTTTYQNRLSAAPNTSAKIQIRACNANGCSAWSPLTGVTPY